MKQKAVDAPGISFEKLVHDIQKRLDPKASVNHNETLTDRLGHRRQFDVVIRGHTGGHPILGVIECKDLARRVGTPAIEAFVTKTRDLNANIAIVASRRGFSKPALEKAKDHGIGTISLLRKDKNDSGPKLGIRWYAEIWKWSKTKMTVHFVSKVPPVEISSPLEILYQGQPVFEWWQRQLVTDHASDRHLGWMNLTLKFDRSRRLSKGDTLFFVRGLTFHALREREVRSRFMQVYGDALFRWNEEQLTLPPMGWLATDAMRSDFSDWDLYDGEMPPLGGFFDCRLTVDLIHFDKDQGVVDLMRL